MDKMSQEYMAKLAFSGSIKREELLLKKYEDYRASLKNSDLKDLIKDFKETSREHLDVLKDKMLKLNYQEQGRSYERD